jgi:hypothetical protein
MFCDFDSVAYDYVYMDVESTFGVCVCRCGAPGREAEMVGESARQGPVRPVRSGRTVREMMLVL